MNGNGNDNERWIDGVLYGGANGQNRWMLEYPAEREGEAYEILPGVFQIKSSAFARSKHLRRVVIPESVKDCGYHVFAGSRELETVVCYGNHIGKYAFIGCTNLRRLELYGDAIYLDSSAFADCANLRHIVIHPHATMTSRLRFYHGSRMMCYVCTKEMAQEQDFHGMYIEYDTWKEKMETAEEMRSRTAFVHERMDVSRRFMTSPALKNKVDETGAMKPFVGDTVIFDLNEGAKQWLAEVQNAVYEACARFTLPAQRLEKDTFHITLHDLCNAPAQQAEEIVKGMPEREQAVNTLLDVFRWQYEKHIRLRVKGLMNMLGNSIVLAFEPVTEEDWAPLCDMYMRIEQVKRLPYKLTPHVTIAYYRPDDNGYGEDVTAALQNVIDEINAVYAGREIELSVGALRYSCFADMNHYCTREELMQTLLAAERASEKKG